MLRSLLVRLCSTDLVLYVAFLHLVFLYCLLTHIRLSFAYPMHMPTLPSLQTTIHTNHRPVLWLPLHTATYDANEDDKDIASLVHACDADGRPERCWRDKCRGHWKPVRMRHCGQCGECRFFFDHHCPWFDNDIVAPTTLVPFLTLMATVPTLFIFSCSCLFGCAWTHTVLLWRIGHQDPYMRDHYWDCMWTWVLGPIGRPLVGLYLASQLVDPSNYTHMYAPVDPRPTFRLPFCLLLLSLLSIIALGMGASTLWHLSHGRLTVETERERTWAKLQRDVSATAQANAKRFAPPEYFWVPSFRRIIHNTHPMNMHDLGSVGANLSYFLRAPRVMYAPSFLRNLESLANPQSHGPAQGSAEESKIRLYPCEDFESKCK